MKWSEHVNEVTKTLTTILFKCKCLKSSLGIKHLTFICYALMELAIYFKLGSDSSDTFEKNSKFYRKNLKIVWRQKFYRIAKLIFEESKVLIVRQIYVSNLTTFFYKYKTKLGKNSHTYLTRHKNKKPFFSWDL